MKRKVKFQEGGAVKESPRNRQLRETMEKFGREGRRVGLAERARQREAARREAARREIADRAASQRADAELTRRVQSGQVDAETMRRMGATELPSGRQDFTTGPDGTTRRGTATGREMVRSPEPSAPARPSASRALAEVATPRSMPLGRVRPPVGGGLAAVGGALAAEAVGPMVNYGREFAARRGAEADARRELNLRSMGARTADAEGGDIAADAERQRQEAARPAPRPASPRPAAAPAPAPRPRVREMTADELNEMELRRIRAERQMEEDDARERRRAREERAAEERQMGGSGNIGAASARERGEQVGPPGDYNNFRKGGMVKPKKMMKGGMVAKPKSATKSKTKPMPFKKGGMIKKGKK